MISTSQEGSGESLLADRRFRIGVVGILCTIAVGVVLLGGPVSEVQGEPAPAPNQTSLELRTNASETLTATGQTELARTVQRTAVAYTGPNHTRVAPFESDRQVIRQTDSEAGIRTLLRSEDALATQRLRDARRAREFLDSRETNYQRSEIADLLSESRSQLTTGRKARPDNPVDSAEAYASAYRTAGRALQQMDGSFRARVCVTSRADPIGELGQNRTLYGRVTDVRVTENQSVTVVVGNRSTTTGIDAPGAPLEPGRFGAEIRLPDEPAVVEVYPGESASGEPTDRLRLDGDGLSDTFEANHSSVNPLEPDTDGDGRLDGREQFTSTVRRPDLNATIELTGRGNVAGSTTVRRSTDPRTRGTGVTNERVSPVLSVETDRNFDESVVRLRYNGSRVVNQSNVAIYRYGQRGVYRELDSTVYPENDTVVASTDQFSTVTALDTDRWTSPNERRDGPPKTEVTLEHDFEDNSTEYIAGGRIVDEGYGSESHSLRTVDEIGTAEVANMSNFTLRARFKTTKLSEGWITILEPYNERVTLSTRGDPWELFVQNFTDGTPSFRTTTNLGTGGSETGIWYETVVESSTVDGEPVVRGKVWPASQSEPSEWQTVIDTETEAGDGLTHRKARFQFSAPDSRARIYLDSYNLTTYTQYADSDGDGLRDGVETQGMVTPAGTVITTDPHDPDTDGDGTPDGEEMGDLESQPYWAYSPSYSWSSNPLDPNTDDRGLNDTAEYNRGTNPFTHQRSLVMAKVPTRADRYSGAIIDGKNDGWIIEPAQVVNSDETDGFLSSAPPWLDSVYGYGSLPEEIPNGKTYALVDIPVYVATENTSATPQDVKLEFTDGRVVAAGYRPGAGGEGNTFEVSQSYVSVEEGVNIISAVVVINQIGPRSVNSQSQANIGNLKLTVRRKPENPFERPQDPTNDNGWSKTTITSKQSYTLQSSGADNVMGIYEDSLERIEGAAITAIGLQLGQTGAAVQGGAEVLLTTGAVSGGSVEAGAIAVAAVNTVCGLHPGCPGYGARDFTTVPAPPRLDSDTQRIPTSDVRRSSVEIRQFKQRDEPHKKTGVRTVYYKYTGVMLVRSN